MVVYLLLMMFCIVPASQAMDDDIQELQVQVGSFDVYGLPVDAWGTILTQFDICQLSQGFSSLRQTCKHLSALLTSDVEKKVLESYDFMGALTQIIREGNENALQRLVRLGCFTADMRSDNPQLANMFCEIIQNMGSQKGTLELEMRKPSIKNVHKCEIVRIDERLDHIATMIITLGVPLDTPHGNFQNSLAAVMKFARENRQKPSQCREHVKFACKLAAIIVGSLAIGVAGYYFVSKIFG